MTVKSARFDSRRASSHSRDGYALFPARNERGIALLLSLMLLTLMSVMSVIMVMTVTVLMIMMMSTDTHRIFSGQSASAIFTPQSTSSDANSISRPARSLPLG